MNELLVMSQTK